MVEREVLDRYRDLKTAANQIEDDTERLVFLKNELEKFSLAELKIIALKGIQRI